MEGGGGKSTVQVGGNYQLFSKLCIPSHLCKVTSSSLPVRTPDGAVSQGKKAIHHWIGGCLQQVTSKRKLAKVT